MRRIARLALLAAAGLGAGCMPIPGAERRASVNGIEISYLIHGHGAPLLLLHGGGGRALTMARQIRDLGGHFTVIAPDSRSHGSSTDTGDTLSYHVMAEDMAALLARLKIGRADLVGWSDGAIIGLDLALHHPAMVGKLVLFGANFTPDGVSRGTLDWLRSTVAEDSAVAARNPLQQASLDARLRRLWLTQPNFGLDELHAIRAPTLVAVGDHDLPTLEHTLALVRAIPGAQLCVIPGASHGVLHERPDIADEIVLQFLRAPATGGQ